MGEIQVHALRGMNLGLYTGEFVPYNPNPSDNIRGQNSSLVNLSHSPAPAILLRNAG
jgi:hypothetical protein